MKLICPHLCKKKNDGIFSFLQKNVNVVYF